MIERDRKITQAFLFFNIAGIIMGVLLAGTGFHGITITENGKVAYATQGDMYVNISLICLGIFFFSALGGVFLNILISLPGARKNVRELFEFERQRLMLMIRLKK